MDLKSAVFPTQGIKLFFVDNQQEIARIWIYIISNSLHEKPYALIEDLLVQEEYRGKGIGTKMVQAAIEEARKRGCYKILATSRHTRPEVHQLYLKWGFKDWGKEFRMDLS